MSPLNHKLFIDGEFVDASSDKVTKVVNPATEEVIAEVPEGTVADARRAVTAARTAFDDGPWGRSSPRERAKVLGAMADIMTRRFDELVDLNIAEAGSIRPLAQFLQVGIPIEHLRDYADRVLHKYEFERPQMPYIGAGGAAGIGQGIIRREAIGVASLITAYNFPLFLNMFKVAPALAAGCTAVLKPAPNTPLEALLLGEVAQEAGLPPGVLNIITCDVDASAELTTNAAVDMVSFTGSDVVGRKVNQQASETLKRVVLELGGKSANVIFEDADLGRVVPSIIKNFTTHSGQGCSLQTRTLIHESIFDDVVRALKVALDHIKIGDPTDPTVTMGPLISEAQRSRVEALIQTGLDEGGQIAYGGGRPVGLEKGFFVEPTVFVDMTNAMTLARREVFGPVAVLIPFSDDAEAVHLANDSDFGLGGGVWAKDPVRALNVARQIRTGQVTINGGGGGGISPHSPFGGYKQSGMGREWGEVGMEEYLQTKSISWGVAGG